MSKNFNESPYAVPASIIAAGLMIAAAIFSGSSSASAAPAPAPAVRAAAAGCGA
jgi:hypothetical protein